MQIINRSSKRNGCTTDSSTSSPTTKVVNQGLPCIVDQEDAPSHTIDNRFLLRGYRCNYCTQTLAIKSIFHLHNETCNIWTHLIPCILAAIGYIYLQIYEVPPLIQYLPGGLSYHQNAISTVSIKLQLLSGMYLFGASAIYHTLFCVSKGVNQFTLRFDYSGICAIAAGGSIPAFHYGFFCQAEIMKFCVWFSLISCSTMMVVSLLDFIHRESFFVQKAILYVTFFALNILPIVLIVVFNAGHLDFQHAEQWFLWMDIILIGGVIIYAMRVPERLYPKRFDYFLSSHQIWHVCVAFAYFFDYMGTLSIFIDRSNNQCDILNDMFI